MMSFNRLNALVLGLVAAACLAPPAWADKIKHPIAVFSGLDKITGRILAFEVGINETVQYGSLQVTPRVCFSRPATEAPRTDVFAEVDELQTDKSVKRLFSGWMFADSPGLHGVEHPVYDIWLKDCKGDGPLIHEAPEVADAPLDTPDSDPVAGPDATPGADQKIQPLKKPKPKPKVDAQTQGDFGAPVSPGFPGPRGGNSFNGGFAAPVYAPPAHRGGGSIDTAPLPPANIGQ